MGVKLEDVQRGVLDTAKVLVDGMEAWNRMQGRGTSTATPPIVSGTVSKPAVSNQEVAHPQSMTSAGGLAAIPSWLWLVGIGVLLWRVH